MSLHAITVFGQDRPGIIAETTAVLAGLGLNLEDSTMTLLRGHFAMMLVCAGDEPADRIRQALGPLSQDGSLDVAVRPVPGDAAEAVAGSAFTLSVHGADRPGIVSAVLAEVAGLGGNVTDLTTRLAGGLYVLIAEVDLPPATNLPALEAALARTAGRLGVRATLRPVETDDL